MGQKIPTHLKTTDKVMVLPLLGIGISARQLLILFIRGSVSYDLWLRLLWLERWYAPLGSILHWLAVLLCAGLTLTLAMVQIAGRPLEAWLVVLLLYWRTPRVCIWRSTPLPEMTLLTKRR